MKDEEVTMHYKTFDTHKYIKSLQESGFNEKQAEMLVKSLLESRDFDLSILATREQVSKTEASLEKQISAIREQVTQLDGKIDKVESNLNAKIDKVESNLEKKIDNVESNLEKKIDNIETKIKELSNTISSNKYDIIKWMVTLFITMIIAIYLKR
jgi:hypothetical protein